MYAHRMAPPARTGSVLRQQPLLRTLLKIWSLSGFTKLDATLGAVRGVPRRTRQDSSTHYTEDDIEGRPGTECRMQPVAGRVGRCARSLTLRLSVSSLRRWFCEEAASCIIQPFISQAPIDRASAFRSDRALGAAASRQRLTTRSDTLTSSSSGTAGTERRVAPREGHPSRSSLARLLLGNQIPREARRSVWADEGRATRPDLARLPRTATRCHHTGISVSLAGTATVRAAHRAPAAGYAHLAIADGRATRPALAGRADVLRHHHRQPVPPPVLRQPAALQHLCADTHQCGAGLPPTGR
eukprot:ctg_411.g203